mgnify:CR=1 FL=1
MGMNPRGRSRGRGHNFNNNNNNRRFNNAPNRNTVYDSLGPVGRLRGTAFQLMEKYLAAAKDAMSSDRVLAENCLQHADHYNRLNLMAIAAEQQRNQQYQQPFEQPEQIEEAQEIDIVSAEPAIEETAEEAPAEQPVETPVSELDLSVPVSAMAANEMKRREKAAEKPAEPAAAPVVRRRGRPPRSAKTAAAQPNA